MTTETLSTTTLMPTATTRTGALGTITQAEPAETFAEMTLAEARALREEPTGEDIAWAEAAVARHRASLSGHAL